MTEPPAEASGGRSPGSSSTEAEILSRKSSLTKDKQRRRFQRQDSKVRFRDQSDLTEAFPPRTLERDSNRPTPAELLKEYKQACIRLKVKPLSKVIQNLETVEDVSQRQEDFNLKGVRLDVKQCEALESIFQHLQVHTLNLESCGLEDEGAMALMEMVEYYECAYCISFANNNKLHQAAWMALGRLLKKSPFVYKLELQHALAPLSASSQLARALRVNCGLVTLQLENNNLAGPRIVILAAAMKFNTNLEHLFLGSNKLVARDAAMLGAMLRTNHTLKLLDLRDNNLQDEGIATLCHALWLQQEGLKALVLWNNRITSRICTDIGMLLTSHKTLHTLNIGKNRIGNYGLDLIKPALLSNRVLLRLGLMETRLGLAGAVSLAEYIADSQSVLHINIRKNDIRVGGLIALVQAHKLNTSLQVLEFDRNIKAEQLKGDIIQDLYKSVEKYSERNQELALSHATVERDLHAISPNSQPLKDDKSEEAAGSVREEQCVVDSVQSAVCEQENTAQKQKTKEADISVQIDRQAQSNKEVLSTEHNEAVSVKSSSESIRKGDDLLKTPALRPRSNSAPPCPLQPDHKVMFEPPAGVQRRPVILSLGDGSQLHGEEVCGSSASVGEKDTNLDTPGTPGFQKPVPIISLDDCLHGNELLKSLLASEKTTMQNEKLAPAVFSQESSEGQLAEKESVPFEEVLSAALKTLSTEEHHSSPVPAPDQICQHNLQAVVASGSS